MAEMSAEGREGGHKGVKLVANCVKTKSRELELLKGSCNCDIYEQRACLIFFCFTIHPSSLDWGNLYLAFSIHTPSQLQPEHLVYTNRLPVVSISSKCDSLEVMVAPFAASIWLSTKGRE